MNNNKTELYKSNNYLEKNPTLHAQDSSWKVTKITPLVDMFINYYHPKKDEVNILDVGGGAGLVLKSISSYVWQRYNMRANKFALDLSPGMLKIQKKNNPDIKMTLNEDIADSSLPDKEMDLVLMIDVIEHVTEPLRALKELKRISRFVIFKVPLEDCIYFNVRNLISRGELRRQNTETRGHINTYNLKKIKRQIEENIGAILDYCYTDVFSYYLNSPYYTKENGRRGRLLYKIGALAYKMSPRLCSYLFPDFVMLLVKSN